MHTVRVIDLVGKFATTSQDGALVYSAAITAMRQGCEVDVDFTGVEVVAPGFLWSFVGRLLNQVSIRTINSLFNMTNVVDEAKPVIKEILDRYTPQTELPQRGMGAALEFSNSLLS